MKDKRLIRLENYAKRNNYNYRLIGEWTGNYEEFVPTGIVIEHDYEGAYPTEEVYTICAKLEKYGKRYGYLVEHSSMKVGTRIKFDWN